MSGEEQLPDDFGIIDTNVPTLKVLWERRGRTVITTTVVEPQPPYRPPWAGYTPPWEHPAPE